MNTPEEIKEYAQTWREVLVDDCIDFPYAVHTMLHTAADVVESLLAELEQTKRERDAAVEDLSSNWKCAICKHKCYPIDECPYYKTCGLAYMHWQWRGVQKEVQ